MIFFHSSLEGSRDWEAGFTGGVWPLKRLNSEGLGSFPCGLVEIKTLRRRVSSLERQTSHDRELRESLPLPAYERPSLWLAFEKIGTQTVVPSHQAKAGQTGQSRKQQRCLPSPLGCLVGSSGSYLPLSPAHFSASSFATRPATPAFEVTSAKSAGSTKKRGRENPPLLCVCQECRFLTLRGVFYRLIPLLCPFSFNPVRSSGRSSIQRRKEEVRIVL
jgi:hypothetical protein